MTALKGLSPSPKITTRYLLFNLFYGVQGTKIWKQQLNEVANNKISINSIYDLSSQLEETIEEAA